MTNWLTFGGVRGPRSIKPFGPEALLLEWEQRIDPGIHRGVLSYAAALRQLPGFVECVPAYASLLVRFSGDAATLRERLYELKVPELDETEGSLHRLPVCYGGEYGPDLSAVARTTGLTEDQVIELHAGVPYRVYLFGYRPGFAFLGTLDERLTVARHRSPRPSVAPGSVGLAGRQTGVYPVTAPGGWQLIGHCPLQLIDKTSRTRFAVGDRVAFYPIGPAEVEERKQADTWPDE